MSQKYLPIGDFDKPSDKTVVASSFGATLEMAREGVVELKQDEPFAPIYMRSREAGAEWQRVEISEAGGA